ncbi:MAG: hypothetical protein ACE5FZ_09435 [Nitrospiria bacterium]
MGLNETNHKTTYLSDAVADNTVDLLSDPESILAHRQTQTYAGVLRPGIKVPFESGKYALSPREKALYKKRIKERKSPREIEKEIGKIFRPKNVPYFSVYRSECQNNPEHADLIRSLYGNSQGEISRLRITFLSDKWWEYLPHNLMAFRRSGLYCSSKRIGGKLVASRDPALKENDHEKGKNDLRRSLTTKKITLPCHPECCPIYQARECQFSGVLHFLILGIPGTDIWRLPTTSFYAIAAIYKKLDDFNQAFAKKGKSIIGIPFELYKAETEISRWDPEKGRVRNRQWIIRLDCPELPLADLIVQMAGFDIGQNDSLKVLTEGQDLQKETKKTEGSALNELKVNQSNGSHDLQSDTPAKPKTETQGESGNGEVPSKKKEGAEGPQSDEKEACDALKTLRTSILSELEPTGEVPMAVVEDFLKTVNKKQFEDLSLEEAQTLSQKVISAKIRTKPVACAQCRTEITHQVQQYSVTHFKKPLCVNCQKKRPSHLPPRTQVTRKPKGQFKESIF